MGRAAAIATVAALAACASPLGPVRSPVPQGLNAEFVETTHGAFAIRTAPGASCIVDVQLPNTQFGDTTSARVAATADAAGMARATFRPRHGVPAGDGSYVALCTRNGENVPAHARFRIAELSFRANDLLVRVAAFEAPETPRDDALEALRASVIAALHAQLVTKWTTATRGLGAVRLVERDADIEVRVVAALGISVHRRARDGSRDVILFVGQPNVGPISVANAVAITLHELGHIWCCRGPGTTDGHWDSAEADPSLPGVDRFGLMNHTFQCQRLATGLVSCPDRFSERELRAMMLAP